MKRLQFSTGYKEIDNCNKRLFDCLNRFLTLVETGEINKNLYGIISELEEHCNIALRCHEVVLKG